MVWGSGVLALACLAVGVLHLVRLAVVRRDVVGEVSHVAMALGMAAMASPFGNPVPGPVWTMVFVVIATWFVLLVVRSGGFGGERGHHVVGSVAMLFMLAFEHGIASSPGGHVAGMGGASHGSAAVVVFASVIAIALAGYFGWHTLRCADRCRRADCSEQSSSVTSGNVAPDSSVAVRPGWSLRTPQTAAAGHLVLAGSMAAMLLTMV
jgi:Domain of unknown function (DUF5134)